MAVNASLSQLTVWLRLVYTVIALFALTNLVSNGVCWSTAVNPESGSGVQNCLFK